MVRFWGYSGDVGSVWFLPSGDVKSTYISRVKATSPESNHTPPELKNHSGDVKNRFWLYREIKKHHIVEMRGDVTDAGQPTKQQQLKIELLSQWKLEAESRNK